MSTNEIQRFAADMNSNAALRAEAEKAQADRSHDTPLAATVAFAVSKGYDLTVGDVKDHIRAAAKKAGKELSDTELDDVAAGFDNPVTKFRPY